MNLALVLLLFAVGLVLIIKGGDFFVDAASWIAEVSGIPKLIVGATVVSLATTLPEMIVSTIAAVQGHAALTAGNTAAAMGKVDMAIGNAIGSVTANTGLIMAISLIFIPMAIERRKYLPKMLLLIGSVIALWLCSLNGELTVLKAVVLIVLFGLFIWENVRQAIASGKEEPESGKPEVNKKIVITNIAKFVLGAAGIVLGSDLLVDNGTALAEYFNVPSNVIALTCVAIGTSLPELVTTITAVVKKEASLSVGNIIGANIIDVTLILSVCSAVYGGALPVAHQVLWLDVPVCLGITLAALLPAIITKKFHRWQGFVMLAGYIAYVCAVCL